jgi:hypothetical protein
MLAPHLKALTKLAAEKGYRLIGWNRLGWNAFLVRKIPAGIVYLKCRSTPVSDILGTCMAYGSSIHWSNKCLGLRCFEPPESS